MNKIICIIIPVYGEEKNIAPLLQELYRIISKVKKYSFEIVFVDDGSSDDTVGEIRKLQNKNKKITLIEFSRNFGKEIALTAGVQYISSKVSAAIFMDADLQHPPNLIPQMIANWEGGFDIVTSCRIKNREQSILKKITSNVFYKILNCISERPIVPYTTDFKLIDQKVIFQFKKFTEHNRMFRGLIDWMGFKVKLLYFEAPSRLHGKANYSFNQLLRLAIHSLISFSVLPLKLSFYVGVCITLGFGSLLLYMLITKFIFNFIFTALAFISVINATFTGLILICMGLMAYYIANIHVEVTNRPLYIVRKIWK